MSLLLLFRPGAHANPSGSDTAAGAEGAPQIGQSPPLDQGNSSDGWAIAATLTATDTGTDAEDWHLDVASTDSGAGSDAWAVQVSRTEADSGEGVEGTAGVSVTITVSDTGTGVDAHSSVDEDVEEDTGVGTDSESITVFWSDADLGQGLTLEWVLYRKQGTLLSTGTAGTFDEGSLGAP